ncbi:MAG: hypothetical protein LBG60_15465 [Bifidobacteriaceae bacterium]|jgi:osmotically-inducible protein OsmY|nr:hypothetical protein [Bifidobacteriaceae bacterium]
MPKNLRAGRPRPALALLALAAAAGLTLSGCAALAVGAAGAVTGQQAKADKARASAAVEMAAKELATWYTDNTDPAQVLEYDGAYYICGHWGSECFTETAMIAPAVEGVTIQTFGDSKSTWCAQAEYGDGEYVSVSATQGIQDGPC